MFSVSKSCALLCKEDSGLRPIRNVGKKRNKRNEWKETSRGWCIYWVYSVAYWPSGQVQCCSGTSTAALQPAAASSCCSKPCYDAAVHNASMERLAWQLLCFAPSTTDLPTKTSGDILTISISCRAAAWYLQFCSGRSCCRPQLQSAVSCFLQYSAATGSGGAAAENCIFYSATLVPAIISRVEMWSLLPSLSIPIHIMIHLHISSWPWSVVLSKHSLSLQSLCWLW